VFELGKSEGRECKVKIRSYSVGGQAVNVPYSSGGKTQQCRRKKSGKRISSQKPQKKKNDRASIRNSDRPIFGGTL